MDKTKLKDALVRILAHVSRESNTDRIADAIEVVEKYLAEIEQDLAEERREQQRKAELVAATFEYWREHVRDKNGRPIPLFDDVKEMIEDLADNDYDDPESLIGDVGVSFCSAWCQSKSEIGESELKLKRALMALKKHDREGFKALEQFCLQYHW